MAFFQLGLSNDSSIDDLLRNWKPSPAFGVAISDISSSSSECTAEEQTPNNETDKALTYARKKLSPSLEQLLDDGDVLQECKAGHPKLIQYLSTPYAITQMLAYISGQAFLEEPWVEAASALPAAEGKAWQPGSITPDTQDTIRKRMKYPYVCTELLAVAPWQLTDALFNDVDTYLTPFWDYILKQKPEQLAANTVQAGHWGKLNMHWLSSDNVSTMVNFLRHLPNFVDRMLVHLPYVSPIFDVITKLINTDDLHPQLHIIDWLHEADLVPQTIELLNPELGIVEAHAPAGELLRGIISAASAACAAKQQQQQQFQQAHHAKDAGIAQSPQGSYHDPWLTWPNMSLVRDLASQCSIDRLLYFMLDVSRSPPAFSESAALQLPSNEDDAVTPIATSFFSPNSMPSQASSASSLLHCLTLLIDIIRKNNSDFTELQIMQYLERMGANLDDFSDDEEDIGGEGEGEEGVYGTQQYGNGPSVVELGPLLVSVTKRLPDIQALLARPRSDITPALTTLQGTDRQTPLTFERFRICELYAELLHCSNMAMLNRVASQGDRQYGLPTYAPETGRIEGTKREAYQRLHAASQMRNSVSTILSNGFAPDGKAADDEGMVEDIAADNDMRRSSTSASDASSSCSDSLDPEHQEDPTDVMDLLHAATEDISFDDDNAEDFGRFPGMARRTSLGGMKPEPLQTSMLSVSQPKSEHCFSNLRVGKTGTEAEQADVSPGQALKQAFVQQQILPAVVDLFFAFPWNNFCHNVIYDLLQQIFNGRLEIAHNRDLCLAVFTQGRGLIDHILEAVEDNSVRISAPRGVRLGNMGHITLISEEIMKLFFNNPRDVCANIPTTAFDRQRWQSYIEGTFRETRERDSQALGGGVGLAGQSAISINHMEQGMSDNNDDGFHSGKSRSLFSADDGHSGAETSPDKAHFGRYLQSELSNGFAGGPAMRNSSSSSSSDTSSDDEAESSSSWQRKQTFAQRHGDNSAFDDYDDEEDDRVASRSYLRDHQDHDLGGSTPKPAVVSTFSTHQGNAEDDGFDPFADSQAAKPYSTPSAENRRFSFDDDFGSFMQTDSAMKSQKLTPADWNSAFKNEFDTLARRDSFDGFGRGSSPAYTRNEELDDDDFGDFNTSESTAAAGDYDLSQPTAPSSSVVSLPISPRAAPPLATSPKPTPADFAARRRSIDPAGTSPAQSPKLAPAMARRLSLSSNPGEEVRGPGVHEGAHISADGHHVEAEVEIDGKMTKVQVPLDEIALHGPEDMSK